MPYANNQGVRIYYEVEGRGAPLIMAHGVTRSLDRWRRVGFADALKNDYKLILFDARGHGKSDKPHDPAAYGTNMVGDVIAVLDAAGVLRANYFGYSMGAGVGFKTSIKYPERFSSFILGGWNPYRSAASDNAPRQSAPQQARILPTDPEAFIRSREEQYGRPLTPSEKKEQLANDLEALAALLVTFRDVATLSNEDLSRISVPCLLYVGDADPFYAGAREASIDIAGAEFFSLPGLNHVQAGSSLLVVPKLRDFLAQASKDRQSQS